MMKFPSGLRDLRSTNTHSSYLRTLHTGKGIEEELILTSLLV